MFSLSRTVLRWGLIGAVGTGGVVYLIGPERVWAAVDQARSSAREFTDDLVDDPVALRRQLQNLAARYPERIAEVAGELAEIDQQRAQLSHDAEVARRVVALTMADLDELRLAVAETDARPFESRVVSIRVSGRVVALDDAREEARRIATIRGTYQDRLAGDEMQREFLATQHVRLSEILEKLESEHTRYETKLWQLDRQIDAIARNDRLIDMTKEQQALLSEYDKFGDVGSLDQLEAKLAELRTVQEAQLQTLAKRGVRSDYEERARSGLQVESYDPLFDPPEPKESPNTGDIASR
jgi:predicted  nucleic acid-binding Zn-ribbon protein